MGPWTEALAWPWWGRSLPKGNQWECWNPGLGPNVVRFSVHLTPLNAPWHSLHALLTPQCPCTPCQLLMPIHPCWPPMPLTPPFPLLVLWTPTPLPDPNGPLTSLHPTSPQCPDAPYTPAGGSAWILDWGPMWPGSQSICHPKASLHLLPVPTPHDAPATPEPYTCNPLMPPDPYTLPLTMPPWHSTPCQSPNTPTPPTSPWCPYTPAGLMPFDTPNSLLASEPPTPPDAPTPLVAPTAPTSRTGI